MLCLKCRNELTQGDKFCGICGAIVAVTSSVTAKQGDIAGKPPPVRAGSILPDAAKTDQTTNTSSKSRFRTIVAILILCIVAVGVWLVWQRFGSTPAAVQVSGPIVKVPPALMFMGKSGKSAPSGSVSTAPSAQQVRLAEKQADEHPGDPQALNDAGCLIQSSGDNQRGSELLARAHSLAPNNPVISYNYARSLYGQGKVDDAMQQAQAALRQKGDLDEARILLADAAIQKKDFATAEDNVNQLRAAIKEIEIAAFTIRGVILLEKGKAKEATDMFQQALKLAGEDSTALYNMGVANQRGNNLTAAQDFYQRALNADPNFSEAHNNLGAVLSALGNLQAALDQFRAASSNQAGGTNTPSSQPNGNVELPGRWLVKTTIKGKDGSGKSFEQTSSSVLQIISKGAGRYQLRPEGNGSCNEPLDVTQTGASTFTTILTEKQASDAVCAGGKMNLSLEGAKLVVDFIENSGVETSWRAHGEGRKIP